MSKAAAPGIAIKRARAEALPSCEKRCTFAMIRVVNMCSQTCEPVA